MWVNSVDGPRVRGVTWVSATAAADAVARRGGHPRIVVSGNHAAPRAMVDALDAALPEFRLWALNAQSGMPDRGGITLETSFV